MARRNHQHHQQQAHKQSRVNGSRTTRKPREMGEIQSAYADVLRVRYEVAKRTVGHLAVIEGGAES